MSWHYLQEPGVESSEAPCSGGKPYAPLKSKTTHAVFYSNGKLTESYLDSLSGTTFAPSMETRGEEKSTLSAGDSLAKTSQQPEKVRDYQARGLDYGLSSHESLAKYDQDSSLWKTRQCSLFGDLELFSGNWPKWGTMRNGESWERTTPAHLISETESGFWPTPKSSPSGPDFAREGREKSGGDDLVTRVAKWATPSARDWKDSPGMSQTGTNPDGTLRVRTDQLARQVYAGGTSTRQTFPTPRAEDSQCAGGHRGTDDTLYGTICKPKDQKTNSPGQLNPDWVEWLMGWPIGWTDLKPLAMDKFALWHRLHGKHFTGGLADE